jgi:hypothetical protein
MLDTCVDMGYSHVRKLQQTSDLLSLTPCQKIATNF